MPTSCAAHLAMSSGLHLGQGRTIHSLPTFLRLTQGFCFTSLSKKLKELDWGPLFIMCPHLWRRSCPLTAGPPVFSHVNLARPSGPNGKLQIRGRPSCIFQNSLIKKRWRIWKNWTGRGGTQKSIPCGSTGLVTKKHHCQKRYLSLIQILYKENVKKYFHMLKAIMLHK